MDGVTTMNCVLKSDLARYSERMPRFQKYFRLQQAASFMPLKLAYLFLFQHYKKKNMVELSKSTSIGEGLYIGHAYCITINPGVKIGRNVNIHKGVTIGQENRGPREGTPVIGDNVWIGVNATVVGNITIGNDVLIASNSYVNRDIPDHSVVFGNPCVVKHRDNATKDYINRTV